MGIAPTLDILEAAAAGGYGVGAFNVLDDLSVRAVIGAAEAARSPVIIQTSVKTVRSVGAALLAEIFRASAERAAVPVALHLDHCPDRAVISECLAHGWNSVLFDASSYPLEDARAQTKEVVAAAHQAGAQVESEIENIRGVEDGIGAEDEGRRYPLEVVVGFIRDTGVDCFAPAVGTAHGLYKERPRLDPQRVSDLVAATGLPMVLHGGTGLTAAELADFVGRGCAKVNISTALKVSYMQSSLAFLRYCEATGKWDPPSLFRHVRAAVAATITDHLGWVGSTGRSAAVAGSQP